MLGVVANIHDSALFEMAVADVKVAMITIDSDATTAELTAVEREVVVVELQEGDAAFAVFEQAIFERGLRERLALVGMVFQDGGIGEAPKRQMPVRDFRLKALGGLVMESHTGFASTIQFKADESRIGHAIQEQHRSASGTIPDQLRVAAAPDDQPADPPGAVRVLERERSGNAVGAGGK